ncbi:hypothetical protein BDK51DRAFT_51757 [Blyttiomyces helicus]|uniref:VPS37 C-terminal domain-containing protein n=1 Tax=Blyttiomyces helicus TaxID=388810 RepID=A0A4P9WDJ2_9FUNG|nr:hypothetical protein BDK51DRAFT_51757 [Blyttiomyces helicus]|eukprot:RKO90422.1 hypothetical protein BDK51DRAFT_51757 [Blyttiomyces helicus]
MSGQPPPIPPAPSRATGAIFPGRQSLDDQRSWGTSSQDLRRKQIASFSVYNLTATEIQKDAQYELPVHTPAMTLFLNISLPSNFPVVPPVISSKPPAHHEWLDPNGVVIGHPKLRFWNQHDSLGKLVKEIVQELTVRPPVPLHGMNLNSSRAAKSPAYLPNPTVTRSQTVPASAAPSPTFQSYPSKTTNTSAHPFFSPELAHLDSKTAEELEALLKDEDALDEIVNGLDDIKAIQREQAELLASNEALARKNLTREPDVKAISDSVKEQQAILLEEREKFDKQLMLQQDRLVVGLCG